MKLVRGESSSMARLTAMQAKIVCANNLFLSNIDLLYDRPSDFTLYTVLTADLKTVPVCQRS